MTGIICIVLVVWGILACFSADRKRNRPDVDDYGDPDTDMFDDDGDFE